ncbi:MAG: aldo/keto reductase [Acetatifactor sp.]|nr:aldo/keto reductase [Acetatifactor sp.]MDE7353826.1 aldo/keto reductase [Acetatifactor sp.]
MEYRKLGDSKIQVSPIIVGCWSMGGDYFGSVEDRDSMACIETYLENGVQTFDTAEIYGKGRAEEVLGQALKGHDRESCTVISKVWPTRYAADDMENACDGTLKRLGTDYLDVYFLHYPPVGISIAQAMENISRLKEKGKIKAIGVSNFSMEQLQEAAGYGKVDVIQPCYNLLWRYGDKDLLPWCSQNNTGVIPYSTLAQGLLTGKFQKDTPITGGRAKAALFQPGVYERCLEVTEELVSIGRRYGKSATQICINWLVNYGKITAPIVGGADQAHALENIRALELKLEPAEYERIDEVSRNFCSTLPEYQLFFDTKVKGE